jgi:flagellar assembly factor FliW
MKCLTLTETEPPAVATAREVRLPMGLLGFEHLKNYLLVANPQEEPFCWLQVKDEAALAFVVINPFLVAPDYQPDLPQVDVEFLGIEDPSDALLFNIVTLHRGGRATVNLKGPIVINRRTLTGKQVVVANASEYAVQHPLSVTETEVNA